MKEKIYVDRLFADYDDTEQLRDFKEEITVNLRERVKEFIGKGQSEDEAFEKATAELGDITVIADDAAKQKRTETIGQMYMRSKVPLTKAAAIGFAAATGLLLLAVGIALVALFATVKTVASFYLAVSLLSVACADFTYFGLSHETTAHYAMKKSRSLAYGVICLLGVLGAGLASVSFFFDGWQMSGSIIVKTVLILPAICGLIFLLATESKRDKPWLKAMKDNACEGSLQSMDWEKWKENSIVDPIKAARFGVASGALWLFVIAILITLGVFVSWEYAWLPPVFALPVQILMVVGIFKKKKP